MKAVLFDQPGDEAVLRVGEASKPAPLGPGDIRIRVRATAVNQADLLQRQGKYPPPPGASEILGLECSGEVTEVGGQVQRFRPGDRVMALMAGGGYAEDVVVDEGSVIPMPDSLTFEEAAAMPEVFLTAFLTLFLLADLRAGETVLVHGGGSGVGTAAITLCRQTGVRIFVTVGSEEKRKQALAHGADAAINYRSSDFVEEVKRLTAGKGVNAVLDHIGGPYLNRNVAALTQDGRLVLIGTMGGRSGELDVGAVLVKRLAIRGSTLRSRLVEEKASIVQRFLDRFGKALEEGRLRPVIYRVLDLEDVAEAHRIVKRSEHFGKVVLRVS